MTVQPFTLDNFLSRFQLFTPTPAKPTRNRRDAAVLIPVVQRAQPGLLLTQRNKQLRKHPGQVAFPGGAVDDTDASPIAAALREAYEEIALPPQVVNIVGTLPPVDNIAGFRVTPVIGIIPPDLPLRPGETEVAAIFEMPLAQALNLTRYYPLDIYRRKKTHRIWLSWYQHYFIWGMTASIIRELALQTRTALR